MISRQAIGFSLYAWFRCHSCFTVHVRATFIRLVYNTCIRLGFKSIICRVVTPCSFVIIHRRFGETHHFLFLAKTKKARIQQEACMPPWRWSPCIISIVCGLLLNCKALQHRRLPSSLSQMPDLRCLCYLSAYFYSSNYLPIAAKCGIIIITIIAEISVNLQLGMAS
jgi:hypothetical protein